MMVVTMDLHLSLMMLETENDDYELVCLEIMQKEEKKKKNHAMEDGVKYVRIRLPLIGLLDS